MKRVDFTYGGKSLSMLTVDWDKNIDTYSENKFGEEYLLSYIKGKNIKGVYVDIGAQIGNHTVFFSEFCPSTKVVAIEMDKKVYEILQDNVDRNCKKPISLYNLAVLDKPGPYVYSEFFQIMNSDEVIPYRKATGLIGVTSSTLDQILFGIEDIQVIKMDIEGSEYAALLGAKDILTKKPKMIIAESTNFDYTDKINKLLEPYGYNIVNRFGDEILSLIIWSQP